MAYQTFVFPLPEIEYIQKKAIVYSISFKIIQFLFFDNQTFKKVPVKKEEGEISWSRILELPKKQKLSRCQTKQQT